MQQTDPDILACERDYWQERALKAERAMNYLVPIMLGASFVSFMVGTLVGCMVWDWI